MLCIVSKYHLQDGTENKPTNQQTKKTCDALPHHLLSALVCLLQLSASTVVSWKKKKPTKSHMHSWLMYLFRRVNRVTLRPSRTNHWNQPSWYSFVNGEIPSRLRWLAWTHHLTDWLTDWPNAFVQLDVFGLIFFHQHCKRALSDSVVPPLFWVLTQFALFQAHTI